MAATHVGTPASTATRDVDFLAHVGIEKASPSIDLRWVRIRDSACGAGGCGLALLARGIGPRRRCAASTGLSSAVTVLAAVLAAGERPPPPPRRLRPHIMGGRGWLPCSERKVQCRCSRCRCSRCRCSRCSRYRCSRYRWSRYRCSRHRWSRCRCSICSANPREYLTSVNRTCCGTGNVRACDAPGEISWVPHCC